MEKDNRECGQCGNTMAGRSDKKFCSDQCRAAAGNRRKLSNEGEQLMRQVNATLRKNRLILKQASPLGKTTVKRKALELHGFDFRHFTHLYRAKNGNTYHFCYDYGYLLLENEKMLIVNWQQYMEAGK